MDENQIQNGDQLRKSIHAVILRSGEESDITVFEVLGVLEIVKADMIERLENMPRPDGDT